MRICVVNRCGRKGSGYSKYCNAHRIRDRCHGHPLQRPVKATEVQKYAKHISKWIDARPNHEVILAGMKKAWTGVVQDALAEQRRVMRGGFVNVSHQRSYFDIATVASEVEWKKIALTMMTIGYLAGHDRQLFSSDRAYLFAYARRFRTLANSFIAVRWNHRTGRNHLIYSQANPMRLQFLGEILAKAFGALGLNIQVTEAKEAREREQGRRDLMLAISEPSLTAG